MDHKQKTFNKEYQVLLDDIPGGVEQCRNDPYFTLLEVNQGFLDMFGFSREELAQHFRNRFADMIHPDDLTDVLQETARQFEVNGKFIMQYRVLCKDKSYKRVLDNAHLIRNADGEERIYCVLLDVTESENDREDLRLSLERHQIILDQTTDIIFEWDMESDTMTYSANWEKRFGYPPQYEGIAHQRSVFRHIHPDDVPVLTALMMDAKEGTPYSTAEIRIQNAKKRYIWCRIRATDQYDAKGKPLKAVGIITDIDKEKRTLDELRQRAEHDVLTGLYNREETERQILIYLDNAPKTLCALLMIDTDNFKWVNDSQGHLFGDAVLSELAAGMKKLTRQSDVVGRIGGDEFIVFLKDIPSRQFAMKKAAQMLDLFQNLFQNEKHPIQITCSAGVAIYPNDGKDFQELYHCADIALYQAKNQGKNQYMLYDPENTRSVKPSGYSALGASIDSDQQTEGMPANLVSYVFQILFDAKDISHAIEMILEIVGKQFDVSRAYVCEITDDGDYMHSTYEWCNQGITPQKGGSRYFPYAEAAGYQELFHDHSIFYCRDIHQLSAETAAMFENHHTCSTLQCAILEGNAFYGFVGFDECTGTRMWNKEEIGTLSLISQLLTTFLLKKRATDRDHDLVKQLNTILDAQDAYIYAIKQTNYELLYLNQKMKKLDPSARIGTACYKAFFGRERPCESCPLNRAPKEVFIPQYQVWTKIYVASIKWGTEDSYLFTCFDITEYKRKHEPEDDSIQ